MDINKSVRNAIRQLNEDGEMELDESQVLEERLKELLLPHKRTLNRPRDVFNNTREEVPKLRKSVVTRALQTYVSSTPMPSQAKRDFFCAENSLNISPINADSDKLKSPLPNDNREKAVCNRQGEEKKWLNRETNISSVHSLVPITISDSSNEEDREVSKAIKNDPKERKCPYNTRSSDKNTITKQLTQKKNLPNNCASGSLPCKNNTQNQEQESSKNVIDGKNTSTSNVIEKKYIKKRITHSNRRRIDINSALKCHISSNDNSTSTESDVQEFKSLNLTRKNRSHSRSRGQNELKKCNELESRQTESPGLNQTKRNGKQISTNTKSKSPSHSTYHELQVNMQEKAQNSSKANKFENDTSKTGNMQTSTDEVNKNNSLDTNDGTNNIASQQLLRESRRKHEQSLKEINSHITKSQSPRVSLKQITHKNAAEKQKGLSPRKLSFPRKDEDIRERNDISILNINGKENKKSDAGIEQPMESSSKIPILRSRSKSKENCAESNIKILRSTPGELHLNECPESAEQENIYNKSKDHIEQIKNVWTPPKSPPKRPPRKKTKQKKTHILEQVPDSNNKNKSAGKISQQLDSEFILRPPELIKNTSAVRIGNLQKNVDTSPKRMKNSFEKYIVQNDTSPNILKTPQKKDLLATSSHNLKENYKNIKVLKDILISEKTKGVSKTLLSSSTSTHSFESLDKEPMPGKIYIERGTSPLIFENEIEPSQPETNIVASDNAEGIKNNNNIPVDHGEDSDLDRTLVEVNITPIKFANRNVDAFKNAATPEKTVADVDTSPWNFDNIVIDRKREIAEVDCAKREKLDKLVDSIKRSKKVFNSSNTLGDGNDFDSRLMTVTHAVHKEVQTSANALLEYTPKNVCREIQTSIRSACKRTSYEKNFSRNVLSRVFEQQTQTTSSLIKTRGTYKRKNKRMERKVVNDNTSDSSTTDRSEILKDFEREKTYDMLFQSLVDDIEPNFSSSDDDMFQDTLRSNNSHNLPYRLDEKLFPQRRSSFNLNFIKSAHEIEIEQANSNNENFNVSGHTRKTTALRRYSRTKIQNNGKEALGAKLDSSKCTDNEKRLSSSSSSISNLVLSDSKSTDGHEHQEKQIVHRNGKSPTLSIIESPPRLPDTNFNENTCTDDIEANSNKVVTSDEYNKDACLSPAKPAKINTRQTLKVVIENMHYPGLTINKKSSYENSATENDNVRSTVKNAKKSSKRSKSRKKSEIDEQQENYRSENEDEILATPLEDSEIPPPHSKDENDKPDSPQCRDILSDNIGEVYPTVKNSKTSTIDKLNFKVPKTQVHKAKKKAILENDGGVSSTTLDSTELGVRRSGRERKPIQRRLCGTIATTSERDITYYNGPLQSLKSVNNSSTLSTKRRNTMGKKQQRSRTKEPVTKKGRFTKIGRNQKEEVAEKPNLTKKISSVDNPIAEHSTNVDIVDNNYVSDKRITNDNDANANFANDSFSQENTNHLAELLTDNGIFESMQPHRLSDKDSGRSTMLKSNISDNSNLRPSKLLTGRIDKKYIKRDNVCSKISKVLSRSMNNSNEMEILNENESDMDDLGSDIQTPRAKPTDSEYINLLCNESLVTMKYVEKKLNFNVVNDLKVTEVLKNVKDGGAMGYMELPPGSQKPLHIAKKFALFYFVLEGEAFIQVHNKTSRIGKFSHFVIPFGTEYSITNVSENDPLTLAYVKVTPNTESQ